MAEKIKKEDLPEQEYIGLFKDKPKYDSEGREIYYKKKRLFKHRVNRGAGGDLVMLIFLAVGGCFMAFPLLYTVSNSLKDISELYKFPPTMIVQNPTVKNYTDLWNVMSNTLIPISKYIFNTLFITVSCTSLRIISACMCAYPLSKRQFKSKKLVFGLITISLMFASPAAATATYIIMALLGLVDTFWVYLLPTMGSAFAVYLVKNHVDGFPDSVLEAARIDGAGEFRIFWRILMPAVKPAWVTLIVFCVQEYWAAGSSAYIFREELKTLNYALGQITAVGITRAGVANAIGVVMMIVPIITFIVSQSNIVETMASAGLKD